MKRVKGAAVGAPLSSPASMGTGSLPSGDERQPIESTQPLPPLLLTGGQCGPHAKYCIQQRDEAREERRRYLQKATRH